MHKIGSLSYVAHGQSPRAGGRESGCAGACLTFAPLLELLFSVSRMAGKKSCSVPGGTGTGGSPPGSLALLRSCCCLSHQEVTSGAAGFPHWPWAVSGKCLSSPFPLFQQKSRAHKNKYRKFLTCWNQGYLRSLWRESQSLPTPVCFCRTSGQSWAHIVHLDIKHCHSHSWWTKATGRH